MDLKRIQSGGASKENIAQMIKQLEDSSLSKDGKEEETKDRIEKLMKQKKTKTQSKSLSILVGSSIFGF